MSSKPGERKLQILQTLAAMLENPRAEKVTTAALTSKLDVSEAALYRHFASKAQMYEGLIEFIETTLYTLVNEDERLQARMNQLYDRIEAALRQALRIAQANGNWPGDTNADANVLV